MSDGEEVLFEFEFVETDDLQWAFLKAITSQKWDARSWIVGIMPFVASILVGYLAFLYYGEHGDYLSRYLFTGLQAGVAFYLVMRVGKVWLLRHYLRQETPDEVTTVIKLTDSAAIRESEGISTIYPWVRLTEAKVGNDFLVIYFGNEKFVGFPRELVSSDDDLAGLVEFIESKKESSV